MFNLQGTLRRSGTRLIYHTVQPLSRAFRSHSLRPLTLSPDSLIIISRSIRFVKNFFLLFSRFSEVPPPFGALSRVLRYYIRLSGKCQGFSTLFCIFSVNTIHSAKSGTKPQNTVLMLSPRVCSMARTLSLIHISFALSLRPKAKPRRHFASQNQTRFAGL